MHVNQLAQGIIIQIEAISSDFASCSSTNLEMFFSFPKTELSPIFKAKWVNYSMFFIHLSKRSTI